MSISCQSTSASIPAHHRRLIRQLATESLHRPSKEELSALHAIAMRQRLRPGALHAMYTLCMPMVETVKLPYILMTSFTLGFIAGKSSERARRQARSAAE